MVFIESYLQVVESQKFLKISVNSKVHDEPEGRFPCCFILQFAKHVFLIMISMDNHDSVCSMFPCCFILQFAKHVFLIMISMDNHDSV